MPSVNAAGVVAFNGVYVGGDGVYTGSGGAVTTVADTGGGVFLAFGPPRISAAGTVAFFTNPKAGGTGIYTRDAAGTFTPIALSSGPVFSGFDDQISINSAGTVAFYAERDRDAGNSVTGIYTGNGGPITTVIQSNEDPNLGGVGTAPMINAAGTVAFTAAIRGTPAPTTGIFARNGATTTEIARSSVSDQFGDFLSLGFPTIDATGTVSFRARRHDTLFAIYVGSGGQPTASADSGNAGAPTTFADADGPYSGQFDVFRSMNAAGEIAFLGGVDGQGSGIFTGPDPVADKVIQRGDDLFGSTVAILDLGNHALNDAGQIAFWYQLEDGRTGIALTNAVPEPAGLCLLAAAGIGCLRRRRRRVPLTGNASHQTPAARRHEKD